MNVQNRITIKGLKVAEFASEETTCFTATVYFDGVKVGTVSNDGHGGCNDWHTVNSNAFEDAEAFAKSLPATTYESEGVVHELPTDLDSVIDDLCDEEREGKRLRRIFLNLYRRKVAYVFDGSVWTLKRPLPPAGPARDVLLDNLIKKFPTAMVLCRLPEADAFAIWMQYGVKQ